MIPLCLACVLSPCHIIIFDDSDSACKITYTPPPSQTITRQQVEQQQQQQQQKSATQKSQKQTPCTQSDWDIYAGVALFMDMSDQQQSGGERKPKWELVLGQGPQRIELDSSRSGRIYKQSLKQLNLKTISTVVVKQKNNDADNGADDSNNKKQKNASSSLELDMTCADIEQCINKCNSTLMQCYDVEHGKNANEMNKIRAKFVKFYNDQILPFKPVLCNWSKVESELEELANSEQWGRKTK